MTGSFTRLVSSAVPFFAVPIYLGGPKQSTVIMMILQTPPPPLLLVYCYYIWYRPNFKQTGSP